MDTSAIPDNIRLKTTLNDLSAWILALDDEEAKIVAAPVQSLINLTAGYPDSSARQQQMANWIGVAESNSWDPPWGQIALRISIFLVLLERGFVRPFSTAPAANESESLARCEPRLAKLRNTWTALREGSLSQQWLAHSFVPDDQPFQKEGTPFPPILKDAPSATASNEPHRKVSAWLQALDEESYQMLSAGLLKMLPEQQLPRGDSRNFFQDWFAGAERGIAAPGNGYIYDRILVLAYLIEAQLAGFSVARFDQAEVMGKKLQSGEITYKEIFPPGVPIPEEQMKQFAEHILSELEHIPTKRAATEKAGASWNALLSEDLADNRLRLWCAQAE